MRRSLLPALDQKQVEHMRVRDLGLETSVRPSTTPGSSPEAAAMALWVALALPVRLSAQTITTFDASGGAEHLRQQHEP